VNILRGFFLAWWIWSERARR